MACPMPLICDWPEPISIIQFEGDPDIAGPGVFLGFVIPAVAASILAFAGFLYVDSANAIQRRNDLDRLVIKTLRSDWLKRKASPWLNNAIEDVAVLLTDQQLIVGSSIMIVGLYQHCTITQYHFYLVYVLGFVSVSTVSLTLELGQDRYLSQSSMRHWRAAWIISMHIFMIVMSVVAADDLLMWIWGQPAQCIWYDLGRVWGPPTFTPVGIIALVINIVILVWQVKSVLRAVYGVKLGWLGRLLHGVASLFHLPIYLFYWTGYIVNAVYRFFQMTPEDEEVTWTGMLLHMFTIVPLFLLGFVLLLLAGLGFSIAELLRSNLLGYIRSIAIIFWGICQWARLKSNAKANGLQSDESKWGFGQVMPLLLLALPIAAILEALLNARASAQALKRNPACLLLQSNSEQKKYMRGVCSCADCSVTHRNSGETLHARVKKGVDAKMERCDSKPSEELEKIAKDNLEAGALEVTQPVMGRSPILFTHTRLMEQGAIQGEVSSDAQVKGTTIVYDKVKRFVYVTNVDVDGYKVWSWQSRTFRVWILVFVSSCLSGILYAAFLGWVL